MNFAAVIFDFGGVMTSSPFEAFNRLEAELGAPADFIRRVNTANPQDNAWARLERGLLSRAEFAEAFATESAALGHRIDGTAVLACLAGRLRPGMVRALDRLTDAGYRIACITNNAPSGPGQSGHGPGMATDSAAADLLAPVFARFEHVIESARAGVRKPDPAIYRMMCDALGLAPRDCVYLDDLGINCKPAATLGMRAIKVTGEAQALRDLSTILGLDLGTADAGSMTTGPNTMGHQ
ncbi:HAD-IA family hydrolase [Novosphingobium lentum]|uniref:HAD-IA family hydrolase n=1 Tax=Novosphingobium lentum TaxID=145287 RepID=UPI00082BC6F9|nr:HAD-IA family hydrolase [Novosphingobium lentum]